MFPVPHQVLVHFPIALLTVYALFELARFRLVTKSTWWTPVKSAFSIIGWASSLVTYLSGRLLTSGAETLPHIVLAHRTFGRLTLLTFGILAMAYTLQIWKPGNRYTGFVLKPWVCIPLALFGLFFV